MTTQVRGTVKGKAKYAILNKALPSFRSKESPELRGETESRITVVIEDKDELTKFKTLLRELKVKAQIKTEDKNGDEIAPQFNFKKLVNTKDGSNYGLPRVVDKHLTPVTENVGNGSDVIVQFKARSYVERTSNITRHSLDLEAVQVLDLIPYVADTTLMFEATEDSEDQLFTKTTTTTTTGKAQDTF